jgi:hypothetical protein
MTKHTVTLSNANGGTMTMTYQTRAEALAYARSIGGKRVRRAAATPRSLTRYELPSGAQVTVAEVVR